MKLCTTCQTQKPLTSFHKCKKLKDGLSYQCVDCTKSYMAAYSAANRDKILQSKKRTYQRNKSSWESYRKNNSERIAKRKRDWYAEKVKSDPSYRLKERIRKMVYRAIEFTDSKKQARTFELLGYDSETLKIHLEKQFQKDMSWDNYGKWHIDHITPISYLVESGITDPKQINCLSNLRPMWASENIRKGTKLEGLL